MQRYGFILHNSISSKIPSNSPAAIRLKKRKTASNKLSEEFNQTVIDAMPAPILVYDCNGRFITVNKAFCETFEICRNKNILENYNIKKFKNFMFENEEIAGENLSVNEEQMEFLHHYIDENGNSKWFEVIKKNIKIKTPGYATFCLFNDITSRKLAEDKLMDALKKEIEINRMKNQFISTISHEFKTPLSIIFSSGELIDYYFDRLTKTQLKDYVKKIKSAVKRMNEMIENLILISKAESNKLTLIKSEIEIKTFCESLIEETKSSTKKNGKITLLLHCEPSAIIKADEKILRHILLNLLSNAAKYCTENYEIDFEVSIDHNKIFFVVKDKGIGINEQDIPNLFKAFYRAGNTGKIPGNGLGLSIAKKFVDIHNGEISVESEYGSSTKFNVSIPLLN